MVEYQEVVAANGYRVSLSPDATLNEETVILNQKHRDLAPKPQVTTSPDQLIVKESLGNPDGWKDFVRKKSE